MACAALALLLFEYRLIASDVRNWDLLAVGLCFVVVKLSLMVWYATTN
jgi:hypothetical protein